MVQISKDEKIEIEKRFSGVHIVRTMKQDSKRHRYYCEERVAVMDFLNKLRSGAVVHEGGAGNASGETPGRV